jgi:hypothetical protein
MLVYAVLGSAFGERPLKLNVHKKMINKTNLSFYLFSFALMRPQ